MTLNCTSGPNPPDAAWTANDIDVLNSEEDSRVQTLRNGNLFVDNATFEDSGTYACFNGEEEVPLSVYQLEVVDFASGESEEQQTDTSPENSADESQELDATDDVPQQQDDDDQEVYEKTDADDDRVESDHSDKTTLKYQILHRLAHMESNSLLLRSRVDSRLERVEHQLHSLLRTFRAQTSLRNPVTDPRLIISRNSKSSFSADDAVADQRAENGVYVTEYTWIINEMSDALARGYLNSSHFLESPPFYTHRPGYRMRILFYPNYGSRNASGLFAGLLPGDYDDDLPWPFPHDYRLSVVSHQPNVLDDTATIRHSVTNCRQGVFDRPTSKNPSACGFQEFFTHKKLEKHKKAYFIYDNLVVKITIYTGP